MSRLPDAYTLLAASFFIIAGLYPPLYIVAVVLIVLYNLFYKWIDRTWRQWATGKKTTPGRQRAMTVGD